MLSPRISGKLATLLPLAAVSALTIAVAPPAMPADTLRQEMLALERSARTHLKERRYKEALTEYKRWAQFESSRHPGNAHKKVLALEGLADCWLAAGEPADAVGIYKQAALVLHNFLKETKFVGKGPLFIKEKIARLEDKAAGACLVMGAYGDAAGHLQASLSFWQACYGKHAPATNACLLNLRQCLRLDGKSADARVVSASIWQNYCLAHTNLIPRELSDVLLAQDCAGGEHLAPEDCQSPLAPLPFTTYMPDGRVQGVLIFLPACGEKSERFAGFCRQLSEQGFFVVAMDLVNAAPLVSLSKEPVTVGASCEDVVAVVTHLRKHFAGQPIFLAGQDSGGMVALAVSSRVQGQVNGVVASVNVSEPDKSSAQGNAGKTDAPSGRRLSKQCAELAGKVTLTPVLWQLAGKDGQSADKISLSVFDSFKTGDKTLMTVANQSDLSWQGQDAGSEVTSAIGHWLHSRVPAELTATPVAIP